MRPAREPNVNERVSRAVNIMLARDGMSRHDLAEAMNLDPATITRSMRGQRDWKLEDVARLAAVFDVPMALLLDDPDTLVRNRCFRPELVAV